MRCNPEMSVSFSFSLSFLGHNNCNFKLRLHFADCTRQKVHYNSFSANLKLPDYKLQCHFLNSTLINGHWKSEKSCDEIANGSKSDNWLILFWCTFSSFLKAAKNHIVWPTVILLVHLALWEQMRIIHSRLHSLFPTVFFSICIDPHLHSTHEPYFSVPITSWQCWHIYKSSPSFHMSKTLRTFQPQTGVGTLQCWH